MTTRSIGTHVLVLQHPQEQDRLLGTVPILEERVGGLRRVGLSWPNLRAAVGAEPVGSWAVLWPYQLPRPLTPEETTQAVVRMDRNGKPSAGAVEGLVALDGSWSQAKALWWRNPWLLKLDRLVLRPSEPSLYGRMRREPRRELVSTLEAVADALVAVGEAEDVRADLRRAMRTMVQRARDGAGPAVAGTDS